MIQHSVGTIRSLGGLDLFYRNWRPVSAPHAVVALVHGIGGHSGMFTNVANALVPCGYALYALDLRGHGQSPGQRGHIDAWAEYHTDVCAFLQMIGGQEVRRPLFLIGHSMGGVIALDYALRAPAGLSGVIASAPPLGKLGIAPVLLTISRVLSRIWPRFAMDTGMDFAASSRDPAVLQAYAADRLRHSTGTVRLGTEFLAAVAWTNAHAAELQVPVLIVHGGADRLAAPAGSRAFFEQVTFLDKEYHEYAGGYHELHNDLNHQEMLADLVCWLERHTPCC